MRLLAVDDEKIVLDSIALIIKKEKLDFVEMESAQSGAEAVEKALVFRPDAVFMDINMPGLSGIDAMKSILARQPDTLFVVITAYDLFDYARDSLRCGASDYIVKPFTPARIVEVINSLNEKTKTLSAARSETVRLREQLARTAALASDGAIGLMINGGEMTDILRKYAGLIRPGGGRIGILHTEEARTARAEAALREAARDRGIVVGSFVNGRAVLFFPEDSDPAAFCEKLKRSYGEDFLLCCGRCVSDKNELWSSYRAAAKAMYRAGERRGLVYCAEDGSQTGETARFEELCSDMVRCPLDKLPMALEELMSCAARRSNFVETRRNVCASMIYLSRLMAREDTQTAKKYENGFDVIMNSEDETGLKSSCLSFVRMLRSETAPLKNKYSAETVRYIEKHYAEDISIESAAKELCVSPGTLGRLLRENEEKSFTELVTDARISKACELIERGEHSMKEICFLTGYNDPNYFSRSFKKVTGLTPSAYRDEVETGRAR